MPAIKVRDNSEVREREFFEKPTQERKRKKSAAVKRNARRLRNEKRRFERLY